MERGHEQDLRDVRDLIKHRLVERGELLKRFYEIKPALIRYPVIEVDVFEQKVKEFLHGLKESPT